MSGVEVLIPDDNSKTAQKKEINIVGIDISDYSQTSQFLLCIAAVFFFYLLYGYMQVLIWSFW
jgi:hypothetical protein